jgi:hypothetical protein
MQYTSLKEASGALNLPLMALKCLKADALCPPGTFKSNGNIGVDGILAGCRASIRWCAEEYGEEDRGAHTPQLLISYAALMDGTEQAEVVRDALIELFAAEREYCDAAAPAWAALAKVGERLAPILGDDAAEVQPAPKPREIELSIPSTPRELIEGTGLNRRAHWGIPADEARMGGDWPSHRVYEPNAEDKAANAEWGKLQRPNELAALVAELEAQEGEA